MRRYQLLAILGVLAFAATAWALSVVKKDLFHAFTNGIEAKGITIGTAVTAPTAGTIHNTTATATLRRSSATADATTSATVAAITDQCTADITAADLCYNLEDSAGTNIFTISENGNTAVTGTLAVTGTTTLGAGSAITLILKGTATNLDLGAAGAGAAVTGDVTVTGAVLGDVCAIAPLQDDDAWDEGSLTCFVEGTDDVKVVYHADGTGGDPAATNDYVIWLIR